ncbi:MAG: hypothetical protein QXL96_01640 [Ignisphaera sp.]
MSYLNKLGVNEIITYYNTSYFCRWLKISEPNIKHYFCILLGSEQWFLETLFQRPRYIVFPNISLSLPNDLKKSSEDISRALCLVYDKDIEKFVGIIYSFGILVNIQLDEFYKVSTYDVTVGSEWFWNKWGGEGLIVILTHPLYIIRPLKYFALDELRSIGVSIGEDGLVNVGELIDEVLLDGFTLVKVGNVYRLAKALAHHQGVSKSKVIVPQQRELARILSNIGLSLGYNIDISNSFESLKKPKHTLDVVWIDKKSGKILHTFKVCSASKAISILKGKFIEEVKYDNYWIALYDVDYSERFLKHISASLNIFFVSKAEINVIGWKDVLEIYRLLNKRFFYKLIN